MKIKAIGSPEIVMQNKDSLYNYFAWPTAARLQNGKIAVAASGFRMGHLCPFGKTVVAISENDGKTYSAPAPIIDTPLDDRDGGILPFGESGVMVTSFNTNKAASSFYGKMDWAKNMGVTAFIEEHLNLISDEVEAKYLGASFRFSNDCGVTYGPIYKSPVSSPHGPCTLSDGSILWVGNSGGIEKIEAHRINLDGTSEYVGEIEGIYVDGELQSACEPYAVQLDDGRLLCHIRVQNIGKDSIRSSLFTLFQSVSEDLGKTWSKP